MARHFSEEEREQIRRKLLETGRRFIQEKGYQKTSIQEITQMIGIAQGSFYTFYSSKEELLLRILEREEWILQQHLIDLPPVKGNHARTVLFTHLKRLFLKLTNHQLMQKLSAEDVLQKLEKGLSNQAVASHLWRDRETFKYIVEEWEKQGIRIN